MSVGALTPFFFDAGGHQLYGVLHDPGASRRTRGCVVVPPFMEERQDAHAVLRDMAETLCTQGFATLRVDLYGTGDSEGEWRDATLEGWRNDLHEAVAVLRARTGVTAVTLVGLRFGATLAALVAARVEADAVVLVQPILSGADYARDLLTSHMAAEMVLHRRVGTTREQLIERLSTGRSVILFGYEFSAAQFASLSAIDLRRDLAVLGDREVLFVEVVRTPTAREDRDLRTLAAALGHRASVVRAVEPNALYAEGRLRVARAEEVLRAMLGWMERDARDGNRH